MLISSFARCGSCRCAHQQVAGLLLPTAFCHLTEVATAHSQRPKVGTNTGGTLPNIIQQMCNRRTLLSAHRMRSFMPSGAQRKRRSYAQSAENVAPTQEERTIDSIPRQGIMHIGRCNMQSRGSYCAVPDPTHVVDMQAFKETKRLHH